MGACRRAMSPRCAGAIVNTPRWPVARGGGPGRYDPAAVADPDSLIVRTFPDPVLRARSKAIADVASHSPSLASVAEKMIAVMRQHRGIGLAAPQVGLSIRMFVVHVPEDGPEQSPESLPPSATRGPVVYINPEITPMESRTSPFEEGCLSMPEVRGDVHRPERVRIRALDLHGRSFEHEAQGLLARCVQHEYDHLDGVLIIDRFTQISRLKTRSAVRALERDWAEAQGGAASQSKGEAGRRWARR